MLQISNLSFAYRGEEIFQNISVILPNDSIIAIIGDNGSGKTTLLRLLARELRPDVGTIRVDGTVAYLPQDDRSDSTKSGGERTRIALEKLFSECSDVLLLDEPTSNLNITTKNWLRSQLLSYRGTVLLVSHDRDFIDRVADYVLELKDRTMQLFAGNYSSYLARVDQEYHEQVEKYNRAHRAAQKAERRLKQAQALSKNINHSHYNKIRDESRMAFRGKRNHAQNTTGKVIRSAKTELANLREIEKPCVRKTYQAEISVEFSRRRRLLLAENLAKSYGEKLLFDDLGFEMYTGERYAILGENGSGKTTLLRAILGEIPLDRGTIKLAPNLKIGYIAQDVHGLDLTKNFLAQVNNNPEEVFQAAKTMDFSIQDLKVPCGELSRGQLTKLAILKIILAPVDLLILDEPTNHLDIRARENIEHVLLNYPGAILLVTHDANFIENLQIKHEVKLGYI